MNRLELSDSSKTEDGGHLLRSFGSWSDLCDVDGWGVGGQDGMVRSNLVQVGEKVFLECHVFADSLWEGNGWAPVLFVVNQEGRKRPQWRNQFEQSPPSCWWCQCGSRFLPCLLWQSFPWQCPCPKEHLRWMPSHEMRSMKRLMMEWFRWDGLTDQLHGTINLSLVGIQQHHIAFGNLSSNLSNTTAHLPSTNDSDGLDRAVNGSL